MRSKQPNDSEYLNMGDYFSGEKAILTRLRSWVRVPHLPPLRHISNTLICKGCRNWRCKSFLLAS